MVNGYKDIIDQIDGYAVGTLIVDDNDVYIETKHGDVYAENFEVLNGDTYEHFTVNDALTLRDSDGWPLLAGLYARCRP